MELLKYLGFTLRKEKHDKLRNTWIWKDVFEIENIIATKEKKKNRTSIFKKNPINPYSKENENILYWGFYIFDDNEFSLKLFKNIGIIEFINKTKILEPKPLVHETILTELGFERIELNTWTKGIFLISILPPKWNDDRGKVIILKKPNVKKLKAVDRASKVVYKGRYFFDDDDFTKILFDKIGFTYFDTNPKKKNFEYKFIRDKINGNDDLYIDKEFLNF